MLKKTIPFFLISALVLGGCMNGDDGNNGNNGNNGTQNNGQEQNRDENWTPNANDNNQGGMDLDGLDDGQNGGNNGFINGDNGNNGGNGANNGNGAQNDTILDDELDGDATNR